MENRHFSSPEQPDALRTRVDGEPSRAARADEPRPNMGESSTERTGGELPGAVRQMIDALGPEAGPWHRQPWSDPEQVALAAAYAGDARANAAQSASATFDAGVRAALREAAAPPPGALERLLVRLGLPVHVAQGESKESEPSEVDAPLLGAAGLADAALAADVAAPTARLGDRRTLVATSRRGENTRPRWIIASALALAVALACALGVWLHGRSERRPEQLASDARRWALELAAEGGEGWRVDSAAILDARPHDAALAARPTRWRMFSQAWDRQGVAYDVARDGAGWAWLFVLRETNVADLPSSPPWPPLADTGQVCVGAWRKQGCLYVLAVQGSKQRYQHVARAAGGGLAEHRPESRSPAG